MSYRRSQERVKRGKRLERFSWKHPKYVMHWRTYFGWTDAEFEIKLKEAEEEYRKHLRWLSEAPHKVIHKEPDYSGPRYILRDKEARNQLREEADAAGCTFIRCPVKTRKGMF